MAQHWATAVINDDDTITLTVEFGDAITNNIIFRHYGEFEAFVFTTLNAWSAIEGEIN
jgi:hypothetical protein